MAASKVAPQVGSSRIVHKDDSTARVVQQGQQESGEGAQARNAFGATSMGQAKDLNGGYRREEPAVAYEESHSQWRALGRDEPIGYLIMAPIPPAPRVEPTTFAPRSGLAWVAGSWAWASSSGWVWVHGRWVAPLLRGQFGRRAVMSAMVIDCKWFKAIG